MRLRVALSVALPLSSLHLLAAAQEQSAWQQHTARGLKYYPPHEANIRGHEEARERLLAGHTPVAVRKMSSSDPGEMFYLDYWGFGGEVNAVGSELPLNTTEKTLPLNAALRLHTNHDRSLVLRGILGAAFQCPSNTHSCASIGHPNACCSPSETCISVSSGVGCCPEGESCGNKVSQCDTSAGYTSCPSSSDGGCCVPGARCDGDGCIFVGTLTVTPTVRTSSTSTTSSTSVATVTVASVPTVQTVQGYTTTVTVTNTPSGVTTTRTVTIVASSTISACPTGLFTCPSSLGGGCCSSGMICGTGRTCIETATAASTATPVPPVLPTTVSSVATTTTAIATGGCPGGFYQCSAFYPNNCCRVGRDCGSTTCPPVPTTTVISSGITVVVSGSGASSATLAVGSCPTLWTLCPSAQGGNCCPSSYICGTASCTAPVSGEPDTGKRAPSSADVVRWTWSFMVVGICAGFLMIWL